MSKRQLTVKNNKKTNSNIYIFMYDTFNNANTQLLTYTLYSSKQNPLSTSQTRKIIITTENHFKSIFFLN